MLNFDEPMQDDDRKQQAGQRSLGAGLAAVNLASRELKMVKQNVDIQWLLNAERTVNQLGLQCSQVVTQYGFASDETLLDDQHLPEQQIARALAIAVQALHEHQQVAVLVCVGTTLDCDCAASWHHWLQHQPPTSVVMAVVGGEGGMAVPTVPSSHWLQAQGHAIAGSRGCVGWVLLCPAAKGAALRDEAEGSDRDRLLQTCVQLGAAAIDHIQILRQKQQQIHTLQGQNQELTQSNQRKSQFLANTSHEIRTPLSSILGFTHLLQQQGFTPNSLRHQEYLKIILTSGQHLLALINDILDLSKIEANQLTLQWETIRITEVCQTAITLVREKAADQGLSLNLEICTEAETVVADGLRLKQMLFNLLSNAVKFTQSGAVGLQVTEQADTVAFTVWDTGTGMSPEQQKLLFRPYFQIANDAVARGEGTGLGLVLTQKLAELHGGSVAVESQLNQGSRFTIALPKQAIVLPEEALPLPEAEGLPPEPISQRASAAGAEERAIAEPQGTRTGLAAAREGGEELEAGGLGVRPNGLLLVEDNHHNAKLVLTYLSRLGYEVTWAKNGKELWPALERSLPAVILMDINLPDTDGLTLIRQLKQHEAYRHIPVIAQTAMAMKGDRDICLAAGAEDYISKPIALDRLQWMVARYLELMH